MIKYYLEVEIRYCYPEWINEDEGDYETKHENEKFHSHVFDEEKDCIDFGNKIIEDNRWMEQYPGYQNLKLERRFGYPLVAPSLKNRAQIFIGVRPLNVLSAGAIEEGLRKFNIDKITKKL